MKELLQTIAEVAEVVKDFSALIAFAALLIKPVREWLFGGRAIREGQKCLLRSEIVRTYYRHQEHRSLRQYEFENVCKCYGAYKALGGNSFIEHIYAEMQDWEVIP